MVKSNTHKHPVTVSRDESNSSNHDDIDGFYSAIEGDYLEFKDFNNQLLDSESASHNVTEDDGKDEKEEEKSPR
eukprot:268598-Ditylum_brightwellii.AAC.1